LRPRKAPATRLEWTADGLTGLDVGRTVETNDVGIESIEGITTKINAEKSTPEIIESFDFVVHD
jgi:hypothetical protein